MARPVGGRLSEAFKAAYLAAGLTQTDVEAGLHARGFTNVDQPLVSKWARGMRSIPLDVLPALDELCGQSRGYLLRRAGFVDDLEGSDLEKAIQADPRLRDEDRRMLLHLVELLLARTHVEEPAPDPEFTVNTDDPDEVHAWAIEGLSDDERRELVLTVRRIKAEGGGAARQAS